MTRGQFLSKASEPVRIVRTLYSMYIGTRRPTLLPDPAGWMLAGGALTEKHGKRHILELARAYAGNDVDQSDDDAILEAFQEFVLDLRPRTQRRGGISGLVVALPDTQRRRIFALHPDEKYRKDVMKQDFLVQTDIITHMMQTEPDGQFTLGIVDQLVSGQCSVQTYVAKWCHKGFWPQFLKDVNEAAGFESFLSSDVIKMDASPKLLFTAIGAAGMPIMAFGRAGAGHSWVDPDGRVHRVGNRKITYVVLDHRHGEIQIRGDREEARRVADAFNVLLARLRHSPDAIHLKRFMNEDQLIAFVKALDGTRTKASHVNPNGEAGVTHISQGVHEKFKGDIVTAKNYRKPPDGFELDRNFITFPLNETDECHLQISLTAGSIYFSLGDTDERTIAFVLKAARDAAR